MENKVDIKSVFVKTCKSIEENQQAMSIMLNLELSKLKLIIYNLENNYYEAEEGSKLIREINKTITSLTMYDWMLNRKIEVIRELYENIDS